MATKHGLILDDTPNDMIIWQVDNKLYTFTKCCRFRPMRRVLSVPDWFCGKCDKRLDCSAHPDAGYQSLLIRDRPDLTALWIEQWTDLKRTEFQLEVEW